MFKVTVEGKFAGYSDTAVFVKVSAVGDYIPCDRADAAGVCVKLPADIIDADTGEATRTVEDIVFALPGGELLGIEQEAELEEVSGALALDEAEEVVSILTGGNVE